MDDGGVIESIEYAMEDGSNAYSWRCGPCGAIGYGSRLADHKCNAPSAAVKSYRCPMCGPAPRFSKRPYDESDSKYPCVSCGRALEAF